MEAVLRIMEADGNKCYFKEILVFETLKSL